MSIAEELIKLEQNRSNIVTAINGKGGSLADNAPLSVMPDAITALSTGGGGDVPAEGDYRVTFIDYDGAVLKEQWVYEGESATPPDDPSHDRLTFDGWVGSYDAVTQDTTVGAMYHSTDGKTHMDIDAPAGGIVSVRILVSSPLTVYWGDGTVDSYPTNSASVYVEHTYADAFKGEAVFESANYTFTKNNATDRASLYITNVVLGDNAKFGNCALYCCTSLTSVVIPQGVTSIGNYAFASCTSLTSVVIPQGVTSIGTYAFASCTSLTSVVIPQGVTSIGNYAFNYCTSLTSVVIPQGVTSIGTYAFQNCTSLTSVVIPQGVTSIGTYAFQNCTSLTSVVIPQGVTSIGQSAFRDCRSLKSLDLPENITTIDKLSFAGCDSLPSLTIPKGVATLNQEAFSYCLSFQFIKINDGPTSIPNYCFLRCYSLRIAHIPSTVTSISANAFQYNYAMTQLVLYAETPPTLSGAFSIITLKEIYVPDASLDAYKQATNWSTYADILKPLSEFTE